MLKKKFLISCLWIIGGLHSHAQSMTYDTIPNTGVLIYEDERMGILGEKMTEYNLSLSKKTQIVNGFRLMMLNTTDRNLAMQLRSTLLQKFPEQKVYTTFLAPYIKLKFGNFLTRQEAESMKKNMEKMKLVEGNIYIISEKVEKKPVELQKKTEE
jgi:hypothetical protein